ncbi:PucR family transcriptional regulator ligand-binding domain-containing protein [Glaciihabitans sp. GrIS 2.15]|uniref:PucR family transcriptional regulator ligand-binding domain-containing protein n=1 Tax=Glaciihabitans sp. GrIS 2.15 TaxID=3071710 RepID=UPI002E0BE05F|nr:purine catabolism regulator [Glaciihabitans sp. GrIS 2.15]
MVTLEQLCGRLGSELRLAAPGPIGRQQLTGVHISELADPTPYLEGGELLLTTGIPLVGGPAVIRDYVGRLAHTGIAALALGLGAGTDRVDPELVSACSDAALDLLLVPAAVPFLHISRAFWQLVGQREQADLASRLSLQTALARAATRDDPAQAIVTALAQGLGGWAAYLPADGSRETIWPRASADIVPQLRAESARFDLVGTYSTATFPLNGMDVVEHSITIGQRTVGFLAVGAGRGLRKADRQLILTSCMLLSLTAQGAGEVSRVAEALGESIAVLILGAHVDAARVASEHAGRPPLGDFARLLAVRGRAASPVHSRELALAMASLELPQSTLAATVAGTLTATVDGIRLVILPETAAAGGRGGAVSLGGVSPGGVSPGGAEYAVALGQPLPLAELAAAVGPVAFACRTASLGTVVDVDGSVDARGDTWVDTLARHPRGDLRDTVRSYLAHRGQWESAARELGIHRNSLRHRIAVASELIDADLADPDTAAALWIALRRQRVVR